MKDSLLISVNTNDQPHFIHVPRQIPKKELIQLLLDKWVTNYEKLHEHSQPIQSTKSQIVSKGDGTIEIKFDHSHLQNSKSPSIFPTQLMMQPVTSPTLEHNTKDPECCCALCKPGSERSLIQSFFAEGTLVYQFRDEVTRHYSWTIDCSCEMYDDDRFTAWIDGFDLTTSKLGKKRSTKKKSTQSDFYKRQMDGDPNIGPLEEDNAKFIYLVNYSKQPTSIQNPPPSPPPSKSTPSQNPPPSPPPSKSTPSPEDPPSKNFFPKKKLNPFPQPCYKKISKQIQKNPLLATKPIPTISMMLPSSSHHMIKNFLLLRNSQKEIISTHPKFHPRSKLMHLEP